MTGPPVPASGASAKLARLREVLRSGFRLTGANQEQLRGFFASTLAASLLAWEITFTLGAYRTVFYSKLLQLLVVSTVLLVGVLVLRPAVRVRPWMVAALATPLAWTLFRLVSPSGTPGYWHQVELLLIGFALLALPLTLWTVGLIVAPELFSLPTRRLRLAAVLIVALISGTGYLVGAYNYQILTCQDFIVAGDDTPSNCANPPPSAPPGTPSPAPS